jgi:hypothetical protein
MSATTSPLATTTAVSSPTGGGWSVTGPCGPSRAIHDDGSLLAEGRSGRVRIPKEYVAEHVDLAYARTGAGAQGRTVDVAILYLDGPTDVRNLYVPMTRGRSTNEVFVATTGEQTALDVVAQSIATDWIDRPALARRAQLNPRLAGATSIDRSQVEAARDDSIEQILTKWRGGPRQPGRSVASGNRRHAADDSTRQILRKWRGDVRAPERSDLDDGSLSQSSRSGNDDSIRNILRRWKPAPCEPSRSLGGAGNVSDQLEPPEQSPSRPSPFPELEL